MFSPTSRNAEIQQLLETVGAKARAQEPKKPKEPNFRLISEGIWPSLICGLQPETWGKAGCSASC